ERSRRIGASTFVGADVAPVALELLQQEEEYLLSLGFAGSLIQVGYLGLGQEQAALIAEHHAFPERAILVLLEGEFAYVVVFLVSLGGLHALEILVEAECPLPPGGTGQPGARCNTRQARVAKDRYRPAIRHERQRLHMGSELVDLCAVDLAAS